MTPEEMLAMKMQMAQQGQQPKPWEVPQGGAMPPKFVPPGAPPAPGPSPMPPMQPGGQVDPLVQALMERNQTMAPYGQTGPGAAPPPPPQPSALDMLLRKLGIGQ